MSDITSHLSYLLEEGLKSRIIIEFGTRGGSSTSAFLLALSELDNPQGKLISVDIDGACGERIVRRFGPLTNSWTFFHGSSQDQGIVNEITKWAPLDLVFIDSSHEASQTTQELEIYAPLLKIGGKFILHDTDPNNVYWVLGVRTPMMDFLKLHPNFSIERDVTFSHGMTTVIKNA